MDYREFSAKIKRTHPDYADMDDLDLAQKMVKKYPNDYSDVTFDAPAGQKQPNFVQSALSLDPNASIGTQVAQGASSMFRGTRGLAVGASQLVPVGMNPVHALMNPGETVEKVGSAIQRAGEATKPGFKPEGAVETVASAIGEAGPLLPVGGVATTGVKGVAALAGMGAGQSMLMQQSEKGSIDPTEVSITAGLSGLLPALPMIVKKVYPSIASWATKVPKEAFDKLARDPSFMRRYSGTIESIRGRANALVEGFQKVESSLKTKMDNIDEVFNLKMTPEEAALERAKTNGMPRDIKAIDAELKDIRKRSSKFVTEKVKSPIVTKEGKDIINTVRKPGLTQRERLIKLRQLDQDLNVNLQDPNMKSNKAVFDLKTQIRSEINKLPGGKEMQDVRMKWSEFKDIADDLARSLTDEDKSPIVFEKLMRGDIKGVLSGDFAKKKAAIKALEEFGGIRPLMEPLRDEILSGMLRNKISTVGVGGGHLSRMALAFAPKLALANAFVSSPAFMSAAYPAIRQAPRVGAQMAPLAAPLLRGEE